MYLLTSLFINEPHVSLAPVAPSNLLPPAIFSSISVFSHQLLSLEVLKGGGILQAVAGKEGKL